MDAMARRKSLKQTAYLSRDETPKTLAVGLAARVTTAFVCGWCATEDTGLPLLTGLWLLCAGTVAALESAGESSTETSASKVEAASRGGRVEREGGEGHVAGRKALKRHTP